MTTELVKSVSIDNLCNQRNAVCTKLRAAFDLLREAHTLAVAAHVGFPRIKLDESKYQIYNIMSDEDPDKLDATFRKLVDRDAWQYLMSESGMRTFMDAKARETWDNAIDKGDYPVLDEPNIRATFRMLHDSREDLFDRGVVAVFRALSWNYKTNQPFKFGKRLVLRFVRNTIIGKGGGTALGYPNHRVCNELDDLSRVMHVLDSKPEPDHRTSWYSRMHGSDTVNDPDPQDDYLSVRCFRNGNGHVTFKRADLVERMNAILAKHYPGTLPWDHNSKEAA